MDIRGANYKWFCRRYVSLLLDFPSALNASHLTQEAALYNTDPDKLYEALKEAYRFCSALAGELNGTEDEDFEKAERIFAKIELIWALGFFGTLSSTDGFSYIEFKKAAFVNAGKKNTLPKNYSDAFNDIALNGCHVDLFKAGVKTDKYRNCESGRFYGDKPLTALGLYAFVRRVISLHWYNKTEHKNYSEASKPITDYIHPFYRADMRIFMTKERIGYPVECLLSGYSDEIKHYFMMIYEHAMKNYPMCNPNPIGFFGGIRAAVSFQTDTSHRMIGQIQLGGESGFSFYCARSPIVNDVLSSQADSVLYPLIFNGQYDMPVESENAVRAAIMMMDAQAKYNKKAGITRDR